MPIQRNKIGLADLSCSFSKQPDYEENTVSSLTNLPVDANEIMSRGAPGWKSDIINNITLLAGSLMTQVKLYTNYAAIKVHHIAKQSQYTIF